MAAPPAKRAKSKYRWCPHCDQQVAERTYRSHKALYFSNKKTASVLLSASDIGQSSISEEALNDVNSSGEDVVEDNELPDYSMTEQNQDVANISTCDEAVVEDNELSGYSLIEQNQDAANASTCLEDEDRIFFDTNNHEMQCDDSDEEINCVSESSSEEELENTTDGDNFDNHSYHAISQLVVTFLCFWQSVFTISDAALEMLLKFLTFLFKALAESASSAITSLASTVPTSLHILRKQANINSKDYFVEYVVCSSCFSLYRLEDCLQVVADGEHVPKLCSHVKFPNHPLAQHRKPCSAALLKKVHLQNGRIEYRPKYVYTYQPIKNSLQRFLNRPGFAAKLENWRERNSSEDLLSDIYDGEIWKEFSSEKYNNFLKFRRNYGVMLNFDFFQPYKHTTESYGVFYLTLMNLPRAERFKQENVILVGIIPPFEHEPPTLNSFLRPIVDELKEFWEYGARLNTAESPGYRLQFKLALMCVACDIPAARKCCGFKGHSANYGCSRCMKLFPGPIGCKDFSGFDRSLWPPRNYEQHMKVVEDIKKCNTKSAVDLLEMTNGVKHSIITELPYFDPIRFTIIDPMHNLFLGTAKFMMKNIWLKKDKITSEQLQIIQCRMDSMKVPSDLGRIPKKIASNFSGFTAEQLKNWVLLYSMYALRGILSQDEYHCWQAFVLACFLVCRRVISRQDIVKADLLFVKFCRHVEQLYGKDVITPNMHLHCHISQCLNDYGSMYGFWCFSYERYNGILGNFPTNKKNVTSQLMCRFIYESKCRLLNWASMDLPDSFNHTLPVMISHDPSEIHRHITPVMLSNNYDLSQVYLPTLCKLAVLSPDDFTNIKLVYHHLYANVETYKFTRTIKILKSIRLYSQQFGSKRDPRTSNSAFIMAAWAKGDGTIYSSNEPSRQARPGRVYYYILNKIELCDGSYREHLFAVVGWMTEHRCRTLYGKPMEIWDHSKCVPDGPATFLPVNKIKCRVVAGYGPVCMPRGTEQEVMHVCPIPNFGLL